MNSMRMSLSRSRSSNETTCHGAKTVRNMQQHEQRRCRHSRARGAPHTRDARAWRWERARAAAWAAAGSPWERCSSARRAARRRQHEEATTFFRRRRKAVITASQAKRFFRTKCQEDQRDGLSTVQQQRLVVRCERQGKRLVRRCAAPGDSSSATRARVHAPSETIILMSSSVHSEASGEHARESSPSSSALRWQVWFR